MRTVSGSYPNPTQAHEAPPCALYDLPGPLLWHWENNTTNDPSVELTLDEVKVLARKIGFEISVRRPAPPIVRI